MVLPLSQSIGAEADTNCTLALAGVLIRRSFAVRVMNHKY
jgi:hypothetical protein